MDQTVLPWTVFMLGWSVGWVFAMVFYTLVYVVAGSWKKFVVDTDEVEA